MNAAIFCSLSNPVSWPAVTYSFQFPSGSATEYVIPFKFSSVTESKTSNFNLDISASLFSGSPTYSPLSASCHSEAPDINTEYFNTGCDSACVSSAYALAGITNVTIIAIIAVNDIIFLYMILPPFHSMTLFDHMRFLSITWCRRTFFYQNNLYTF